MAGKSSSDVRSKWARVTPQRTEDFIQGVSNPRRDWKASTAAAETRYKEGVQKSITENRFKRGIDKTSTDDWKNKTISKGQNRWGEGVAIGADAYEKGISPYLSVASSLDLGPKFPRGDPRNIDRVAKIAKALHAKRISG